jgi:6-phosphogluconolactonase
MQLNIAKDIDELSQQVAAWIINYTEKILNHRDRFTIVLSGGNTPQKLYQLFASDKYKNKIAWSKLHFFWGDERFVPFTDERNNAKMAFENLLDHVPVLKNQIHMMRTDIEPEAAAAEYETLLHEYFPDSNHTFDLVLLGLGDNSHTLSLFPGYDIIKEKKDWVKSFYLKEQKMYRITLTAPVVNAAGRVAFLVSGSDKAAALYHVLSDKHNPDLYPAQVIQPYNDELYWWADKAAAADIE